MSALTVAGGLYRERCIFPEWDRVFGSGGRAAAAVAGHVDHITLRTYASTDVVQQYRPEVEWDNVDVCFEPVEQEISFKYVHSLSTPVISPMLLGMEVRAPIEVVAECVLRFGMLEGTAQVDAERCVYDPQSAFRPDPFDGNGSRAEHLAIVGNRSEVGRLGGSSDSHEAAHRLVSEGAEVVVVKRGVDGAVVVTKECEVHIEAYQSNSVFSLGSGDVFSAVFAARWGVHGDHPVEAARLASSAVASYADTMALPAPLAPGLREGAVRAEASAGCVYLAAPFFTIGQRYLVEEVRETLSAMNLDVFSPVHDVGPGSAERVAPADIDGLRRSDVVFAILDGLDSGTLFEVGYARALGKPVYVLAQNVPVEDLKMIVGTDCRVYRDLVTALHHLAWRK